jgi:hypothetical protein
LGPALLVCGSANFGLVTANPREFDIVLSGATGFVGKLTAD